MSDDFKTYTDADLPIDLKHGEVAKLAGGKSVSFETNGECKDVFLDDAFAPTVQLFPSCTYEFESGGNTYRLTGLFEDDLRIEKI